MFAGRDSFPRYKKPKDKGLSQAADSETRDRWASEPCRVQGASPGQKHAQDCVSDLGTRRLFPDRSGLGAWKSLGLITPQLSLPARRGGTISDFTAPCPLPDAPSPTALPFLTFLKRVRVSQRYLHTSHGWPRESQPTERASAPRPLGHPFSYRAQQLVGGCRSAVFGKQALRDAKTPWLSFLKVPLLQLMHRGSHSNPERFFFNGKSKMKPVV